MYTISSDGRIRARAFSDIVAIEVGRIVQSRLEQTSRATLPATQDLLMMLLPSCLLAMSHKPWLMRIEVNGRGCEQKLAELSHTSSALF